MRVDELLQEQGIQYKISGQVYVVKCLNPEHEDTNPSMRIDRISGIMNCFSCNFKGNLFKHFGAEASFLEIKRQKLRESILKSRSVKVGLTFPKGFVPYMGNWRAIKLDTYKHFEAFTHHDAQFIGRVVFPIRDITGKVVAFIGRHQDVTMVPKYLIYPPQVELPLFPPKPITIKGSVILVEGIYDMINLYDKGLANVVCAFGIKGITEQKISILKMQGVERIDILFDADKAGQEAGSRVKETIEELGMMARRCSLSNILGIKTNLEMLDPGSLTEVQVTLLRKRLYSS